MLCVLVRLSALLLTGCIAASAAPAFAAERIFAEVACAPKGGRLDLECRLTLVEGAARKPVTDQTIVVTADMPSMPGMHAARPIRAAPTPDAGVYIMRLTLDMAGRWALKIRVGEPPRGETVVTIDAIEARR